VSSHRPAPTRRRAPLAVLATAVATLLLIPMVAAPAQAAPVVIYQDSFSGAAVGWDDSGASSWVLQSGAVGASGQYAAAAPMPSGVNQIQQSISTAGYDDIQLSFRYAITAAAADSSFMAHYYTGTNWVSIGEYSGAIGFNTVTAALPASAADNPAFRLRFLVASTAISSDFSVLLDDVELEGEPIPVDSAAPTVVSTSPVSGATITESVSTTYQAVVDDDLTPPGDLLVDYTFSAGGVDWVFERAFIGRTGDTATRAIPGWQIVDELGLSPGDTFTWTVTVEDAVGSVTTHAVTPITYLGETPVAPTVETISLPAGEVGEPYLAELLASGTGPFTWTSDDPLPAGLTLDAATGIISGIPTVATIFETAYTATNGAGSDSRTLTLTTQIAPAITTVALPDAAVGSGYSTTVLASGTTPRVWSIAAGSLPPGMAFSSNTTSATISTAPTVAGTYAFTLRVENQVGFHEREFTIEVAAGAVAPSILTIEVPDAVVGEPYSFAFDVSGTDPTYAMSLALPDGLVFDEATGVLSGVPTTIGDTTLHLFAMNGAGSDDEQFPFSVVPAPVDVPPTVTTTSLPDAVVGVSYSHALAVTGTDPITWSATSLPEWLDLHPTSGVLSGLPIEEGTVTVEVTATNAHGDDSASLTLDTGSRPAILSSTLASGTVGVLYAQNLLGSGTPVRSWSTSDALPDGLTLDGSGLISGTPTAAGTVVFEAQVENEYGSATRDITLTINPVGPVAPSITSAAPADGTVGALYLHTFTATGTGPIGYAVTDGALPDGLAVSGDTITGTPTPTSAGSYTFDITASNGTAPDDVETYTLEITVAPTITWAGPVDWYVGVDVTDTVTASGTLPVSYAVTGGALPDGVTLAPSGQFSGAPTTVETATFTITATNATGGDSESFSIAVLPAPVPPTITSAPPTDATVGIPYSFVVAASGEPDATFAVTSGSLPPGLDLDAVTGEIFGAATAVGSASFAITASNGVGLGDTETYTIHVLAVPVAPVIDSVDPVDGAVGAAYSHTFTAAGTGPVSFAVTSGALPDGVTLVGSMLTGTPTVAGTYSFAITASNGTAPDDVESYVIEIAVAPLPPTISGVPGAATVGVPYGFVPTLTGTGPLSVAVSGALPAGLVFDPASGAISGTPADTAGSYPIELTVSGATGPDAVLVGTIELAVGEPVALYEVRVGGTSALFGQTLSVGVGGSLTFAMYAVDAGGNLIEVTNEVEFSSDVPTDVVSGATIGFPTASPHTITARHLPTGFTFTFVVEVVPAAAGADALASTGSTRSDPLFALALLALGVLLVGARRLRAVTRAGG
jgi:hypothetical protein